MDTLPTTSQTGKPRTNYISRLFGTNPIIRKEVRTRMRSLRTFFVLTGFLVLLSVGAVVIMMGLVFVADQPGSLQLWQRAGKIVFYTVFILELFLISFIAPALTAGAIASERERQTYDLLRTTLLSEARIIIGKLSAALLFLLILLLSSLPLFAIAFTFGGVETPEIIIGLLIILFTTINYSSLGMFFSTIMKRPLLSTILTYAIILLFFVGIPLLILTTLVIGAPIFGLQVTSPSIIVQITVYTIGWLILSMNPITAAIASEIIYLSDHSIFVAELTLTNGSIYRLLSPWVMFLVFSAVAIALLLLLSIQILSRPEK